MGKKKQFKKEYERKLAELEVELVKLQDWVKAKGLKIVVIFEGRDTAGKGGVIKRITNRVSPRVVKVVALPAPTEREKSQYYLQRYIIHLPAAGEMVLFDRSWYNRAGVERVMGFCTDKEYWDFLTIAPQFERTLVNSGIILIKYWLDITQETQEERFQERVKDLRKQWKLSPIDIKARSCWDDYTKARDIMFEHTSTVEAPWFIVDANSQPKARINCISHLLSQIPYQEIEPEITELAPYQKGNHAHIPEIPNVIRVPELF